ncbi:MAG: hypothetical protein K2H19_05450 [Ruminococcus sp.]|nr:hypothetical protein [Ruminococcus sp.]
MYIKKIVATVLVYSIIGNTVSLSKINDFTACAADAYSEILDMFYDNISTGWLNYNNDNGFYGIDLSDSQNISYMWNQYNKDTPLSQTGYQIIDINGDGTDELIVGVINDYDNASYLYDLYTVYEGKAVHIASEGERDRFYLTEDNMIWEDASGGAANVSNKYYTIENGILSPVEEYEYDGWTDAENPYFYADEFEIIYSDYGSYYSSANRKHIIQEEYSNQGHEKMELNFILFSDYKKSESDYVFGDINNDGLVNSSDASIVLAEYAALSTSSESTLNDSQKKAADINNDGMINAVDASFILAFYSYLSTGSTEKDIIKWLEL